MARFPVVLLVGVLLASCSKGGDSGSNGGSASGNGNPTSPAATGEPTALDWTELGAQLASIGASQIAVALTPSGPNAVSGHRPKALSRPVADLNLSAGYFCCGPVTLGTSHIIVETSVTVTPGAGALGILQTIGSFTETEWSSTVANKWRIDLSKLRITAEIQTAGDAVNAAQQLRMQGQLAYTLPNSPTGVVVNVDVLFSYPNLESSAPTATGQMGPVTLAGQTAAPTISPPRCSRPREGCGPLVNGDAPCTVWPACPAS